MDDVLQRAEVVIKARDSRLDVSLQLTAAKMREAHHLQVANDCVSSHLHGDMNSIPPGNSETTHVASFTASCTL